jgi:hypothetical protein
MEVPMAEWKIKTRTPQCAACERAFPEGERHVSALSLQGEELQRIDSCEACFRPEAGRWSSTCRRWRPWS